MDTQMDNQHMLKNQLRSRARKLKVHAQATGGGPPINGITEFEEQAITTFGAATVDGLPGVATLGHQVLPPLYLNTAAQAPASSPTPTVTSPAPAFPALSINFSSSPSPPGSATGVNSHGSNGHPWSPNNHESLCVL
ncbi:uncharacterized protein LOC120781336 [Bactrocera tryoni]|uniref:uncharacterized protein LOC120781336 n=1 Tax=Bactrocera tryoni TaxID=59916 RepID=UPI001A97757D|nr:uncharacterized protein LOC120781336 [Bactrocera tryoni]